ncbi:DUF2255 family protein [Plantactinospora sp. WMMC1484]|uniref:DUF2255 family protein n=1 Tax=Plantactinospora sp. WMMC1484 TaxID=3404122 RepID=UPI003BF5CAA7
MAANVARPGRARRVDGQTVDVTFAHLPPTDQPELQADIDQAYVRKYGSLSDGIVARQARTATVRLAPRESPPSSYDEPPSLPFRQNDSATGGR